MKPPEMELPEIVEVARNFAVMVRIEGPDSEGLKKQRYVFYDHKSGKTSVSASGLLMLDPSAPGKMSRYYSQQHSSVSALVMTTASIVEPFLEQDRNNPSQVLSRLIHGARIDVLVERNNRAGEKLNESDDKTPHWLSAKLLALVDVPASSLALQSLLEACVRSPQYGSWEVGWSLAPLRESQSNTDDLRTKDEKDNQSSVESQRYSALNESSSPMLVAKSATRIALLEVSELNSKDFPNISVSQPNKRGDLLLVMGSPFGIQLPLHFLNSVSVGAVSNCCPPGSQESSLLMSDIRCLPGMEGGPVFGKHACLIGILTTPIRQKNNGVEIQLVITWDAISTALRDWRWKVCVRTWGNQDGYDIKKAGSHNITDFHRFFNYTWEPPKTHCSPSFEKARPSIVLVVVGDGAWGSGIVLNNQGLILTNAHVLEQRRFADRDLSCRTDVTTFPALSTLSMCEQERSDYRKGRQWSSPSLVRTMDGSVGDDPMEVDSIEKGDETYSVRLDHMESWVWCNARAVYVSKGSLDIALLQLESVPNQLCPITPHFERPSSGSKAFLIGHGLFGPTPGLHPSVYSGVVAREVEKVYGSGVPDTKERYLQAMLETTAVAYPGASGGAVVNSDGHMIGLVTGNLRVKGKHGGRTIASHTSFSIPCAALRPVFNFSRDMQDMSILEAINEPNEFMPTVRWMKQEPSSQRPACFSYLPKSLMENIKKGSRFVKSLAKKGAETSPGEPPPSMDQPIKEEFLTKILPSKL